MTNLEFIQESPKKTKEDLVNLFCDLFQKDCDNCPATNTCRIGHTGFIDWLEQEVHWAVKEEEEEEDEYAED